MIIWPLKPITPQQYKNKRLLAMGPQTPRLLCKFKYWNYSVISLVGSVEKSNNTSDHSLTSYHPEIKNLANLKYKKGHNSGKIVAKSSLSNLSSIFIRYIYISHLASIWLFIPRLSARNQKFSKLEVQKRDITRVRIFEISALSILT
jgi:hypothetical protein